MAQPLVGMDVADLRDALRTALGPDQPAYRARQIYQAIYRGQTPDLVRITTLPNRLQAAPFGATHSRLPGSA